MCCDVDRQITRRMHAEPDTSPIVPLWVERGLYSGRDASQLGLREGFQPHQLQQVAAHGGAALEPLPAGQVLESMSDLDPEILRRSEFVEPAQKGSQELYSRLIAALNG